VGKLAPPGGPRPTSWTRSGCARSPSGRRCGPSSCRLQRSADSRDRALDTNEPYASRCRWSFSRHVLESRFQSWQSTNTTHGASVSCRPGQTWYGKYACFGLLEGDVKPVSHSTEIFTVIGLVINSLGLIFVAVQLVLGRRQIRREAARLKRQSTIDFYMTTLERVGKWRANLPDDWDKAAVDQYVHNAYNPKDSGKLQTLAGYLGYFESLAVAVRTGIYDVDVLDLIAGSRVINISQNYQDFFSKRRVEVGADTAYRSLEWLGSEILKRRGLEGPGASRRCCGQQPSTAPPGCD
jgi:hypothetical protein